MKQPSRFRLKLSGFLLRLANSSFWKTGASGSILHGPNTGRFSAKYTEVFGYVADTTQDLGLRVIAKNSPLRLLPGGKASGSPRATSKKGLHLVGFRKR